jgi:hypothetical protein
MWSHDCIRALVSTHHHNNLFLTLQLSRPSSRQQKTYTTKSRAAFTTRPEKEMESSLESWRPHRSPPRRAVDAANVDFQVSGFGYISFVRLDFFLVSEVIDKFLKMKRERRGNARGD